MIFFTLEFSLRSEFPKFRSPVPISSKIRSSFEDRTSTQEVFPPKESFNLGIGNDPLTPQNFTFIAFTDFSPLFIIGIEIYSYILCYTNKINFLLELTI